MKGREGSCARGFGDPKVRSRRRRIRRNHHELGIRVRMRDRTCQRPEGLERGSELSNEHSFGSCRSCSNGPVWSWNPYVGFSNTNSPDCGEFASVSRCEERGQDL